MMMMVVVGGGNDDDDGEVGPCFVGEGGWVRVWWEWEVFCMCVTTVATVALVATVLATTTSNNVGKMKNYFLRKTLFYPNNFGSC